MRSGSWALSVFYFCRKNCSCAEDKHKLASAALLTPSILIEVLQCQHRVYLGVTPSQGLSS